MAAPDCAGTGDGTAVESRSRRCRICGEKGNLEPLHVREMMFGTREAFRYHSCENCGSFQLAEIRDDLSPYYPDEYETLRLPEQVD